VRQRRAAVLTDPRILGTGDFVERLLRETDEHRRPRLRPVQRVHEVARLIRTTCARAGIIPAELQAGSRRGDVPAVRAALAQRLVIGQALALADAARQLGYPPQRSRRRCRRGNASKSS